jgi:hypothetical protein
VFLGAGIRLGLPSHPASRRRSCLRLGVSTTSSSRGLSPPSDRPCRAYSRRRLRRRWPGVSAALSLGEARPAQPGHTAGGEDQQGESVRLPVRAGPSSSAARLSSSRAAGQGRLGRRTRWLRQPGPAVRSQGPWRLRERRTGPGLPCPALGWNQAGPGLLRRDAVPQPVRACRRARLEAQRVGKPFHVGTLGIGVHVVALAELLGQVLGSDSQCTGRSPVPADVAGAPTTLPPEA